MPFPHYDKDSVGPASAIYLGDLKMIRIYETGKRRLFDLGKDPGERNDPAKQMPEMVADLNQRLIDYLKARNAQMPARTRTPIRAKQRVPYPVTSAVAKGKAARAGSAVNRQQVRNPDHEP